MPVSFLLLSTREATASAPREAQAEAENGELASDLFRPRPKRGSGRRAEQLAGESLQEDLGSDELSTAAPGGTGDLWGCAYPALSKPWDAHFLLGIAFGPVV